MSRSAPEAGAARRLGAAAVAIALLAPAPGPAQAPLDLASFPRTTLQISHRHGQAVARFPFEVWVADTPQRAEQGLMFVSDLPEHVGMVFPLAEPRVETMWMKNTYIELDMLFIRADHHVVKIIERAHPMSLQTLSSDVPVVAVLELRGGEAARLGLAVGDTVTWKTPP